MKKFERILAWGAVIILLLFSLKTCGDLDNKQSMIDALSDDLHTYKDKDGLNNAYINNFKLSNAKDLLRIKTQDSTIKKLQDLVKDYKGKLQSAVVFGSSTNSNGTTITKYIPGDTVIIDSIAYVYPKYETQWSNKWETGYILAERDSIKRQIKIKNEYEITIGEPKSGLFSRKQSSQVQIKNLNPNTETTELRSISVETRQKKLGVGISVGIALGKEFSLTPYVGLGLNYNIISIK